jgi:very-short-patch-repair endonuclease
LYLNELWITVVRYTNDEVIENLDWVCTSLLKTIETLNT